MIIVEKTHCVALIVPANFIPILAYCIISRLMEMKAWSFLCQIIVRLKDSKEPVPCKKLFHPVCTKTQSTVLTKLTIVSCMIVWLYVIVCVCVRERERVQTHLWFQEFTSVNLLFSNIKASFFLPVFHLRHFRVSVLSVSWMKSKVQLKYIR